ncbi:MULTISPECIES: hypothetical protein [unclassified Wolbachia]|uniref:hypothetical protein n=1 Tax=unclassified Wolbachia TaxID=2640676 RepID=UPI0039785D05
MGVISVRDTGFHPKGCHPSAQTLGSRKFDCVLYNIFDQKLDSSVKHWNDITGALEFLFQYLYISHASEQIHSSYIAQAYIKPPENS